MRQDKDRTAKWLLSHHGESVLRLAGITVFTACRPSAAEVVAPRRTPDGLLEVTFPGRPEPDLVLVEIETYPSADADRQVFEDVMLVTADRGRVPEVALLVLKPKGNQTVTGGSSRSSRLGTTEVTGRWPVVNVWELDAEALLAAGDPGLIPWVPLARTDRSADDVLADCRDRIAGVTDPRDRSGLAAVTVILAGLAYPGRNILSLFGGAEAMIESPVLDEVKDLIRKRERMAAVQESVTSILEARFGTVPDNVRSAIAGVTDPVRLEALVRLAATCPDVAAFAAALDPNSLSGC